MKKPLNIIIAIAVLIALILIVKPFYFVEEGELAVVTQFGKIVDTTDEAGIHLKAPIIDQVQIYPEKVLAWDGDPQKVPTKENQFIWVDVTARWRINDPETFYKSVSTLQGAYGRLDEVIDSAVRTAIAKHELTEAVRNSNVINEIERTLEDEQTPEGVDIDPDESPIETDVTYKRIKVGRNGLAEIMLNESRKVTPQYGIDLMDVVIRQIRYSDDLTQDVYNRMIAERNQIAQFYRSLGQGKKDEWQGKLEREKQTIISEAEAKAERIKGEADAYATRIYAQAYQQDPEFFEFWQAIKSYPKTMDKFNKTLGTDMDYFEYLYSPDGR